jgi:hypothetical protein
MGFSHWDRVLASTWVDRKCQPLIKPQTYEYPFSTTIIFNILSERKIPSKMPILPNFTIHGIQVILYIFILIGMESTFTNVNAFQPNSLVAPQTSRNMSTNTQLQMEINIPTIMAALTATAAGVLYISGAGDRDKQRQYAEYEAETKQREAERARQAYIEPRNFWREEELRDYDGSKDPDGPILIAADGRVWNVYKVSLVCWRINSACSMMYIMYWRTTMCMMLNKKMVRSK